MNKTEEIEQSKKYISFDDSDCYEITKGWYDYLGISVPKRETEENKSSEKHPE